MKPRQKRIVKKTRQPKRKRKPNMMVVLMSGKRAKVEEDLGYIYSLIIDEMRTTDRDWPEVCRQALLELHYIAGQLRRLRFRKSLKDLKREFQEQLDATRRWVDTHSTESQHGIGGQAKSFDPSAN
jgi:hypothetical protein